MRKRDKTYNNAHQVRSLIFKLQNEISKSTHEIDEKDVQRCPATLLEVLARLNHINDALRHVVNGDDIVGDDIFGTTPEQPKAVWFWSDIVEVRPGERKKVPFKQDGWHGPYPSKEELMECVRVHTAKDEIMVVEYHMLLREGNPMPMSISGWSKASAEEDIDE